MRLFFKYFILIPFSFIFFSCAFAQSNNPQQLPIDLQADQGEYQADKGIATYTGNVIITQGEMKLTADKIIIHLKNGKVSTIEAWGRPAKFHYLPAGEPPIDAQGLYLNYNVPASTVEIDKKALVKQGKNETRANHLIYDLKRENIKAQGVKMTFEPKTQ